MSGRRRVGGVEGGCESVLGLHGTNVGIRGYAWIASFWVDFDRDLTA